MATEKRAFITADGTTWPVEITYATVKRLKAAGVTLADLSRGGWAGLGELLADLERFVDAVYEIIRPAAEKAGVGPAEFAAILNGPAIEQAADAFVGALADFTPSQSRPLLLALAAKEKEVAALAIAEATREVEAVSPAAVVESLKTPWTPNASASNAPGSPASTPAP